MKITSSSKSIFKLSLFEEFTRIYQAISFDIMKLRYNLYPCEIEVLFSNFPRKTPSRDPLPLSKASSPKTVRFPAIQRAWLWKISRGQAPGTTLLPPEYEFRSDEAGQFNFGVEDIKIRNVQRRALIATSLLILFATVAIIIISQRNCILEP